jgi:hypothetical protein
MRTAYPAVPWEQPIHVQTTAGTEGWGCRLCIARLGLHGSQVEDLWPTADAVREHLSTEHWQP